MFVGLVTLVLSINAVLDLYFAYEDNRRASINVQREKADAASQRVEQFVREIERQIGWVAHAQWALLPEEQRRFDYSRLQRQVPAITELTYIDRNGREQLKVSRLAMDVIGGGVDRATDDAFVGAVANKVYFGSVYFHKESEPHVTMAVAHGTRGGVTVAVVNLKLILEVVSDIRIGKAGYAYVVDSLGRLIAHPDMSLVLRGTDLSRLSQVTAALNPRAGAPVDDAKNLHGIPVLSAHATIPALNWTVFVELPTAEAREPVYVAGLRALALLVLGLLIAALAAALLARRMVVPIRTLQAGAARIGGGELGHRLNIKTGDELEELASQFNRSAEALQESYANLEQRVMDRTQELSESLEQQTATAEILEVISQSPNDVQPVLNAIAKAALRFCGAPDVMIALREGDESRIVAHEGSLTVTLGARRPISSAAHGHQALVEGQTIQTPDSELLDPVEKAEIIALARLHKWRSATSTPMMRDGVAIGTIILRKPEPGALSPRQVEMLEAFAAQAVIAIENVRLFTELRESLEQQTATAEILHAISRSPTDVRPVLEAVGNAATRFCGAPDAVIQLRNADEYEVVAHHGPLRADIASRRPLDRSTVTARSMVDGRTVHAADVSALDPQEWGRAIEIARETGWQAAVAAPMMREGHAVGAILLRKPGAGAFTPRQIQLLETFASQAVIAIENVRLFTEIQDKSRQLEIASQHKSQFLANMSHELRTPLNAILGYTEMMADGLYGELGDKATGVLERVQSNGRHLLGLINDVLDLSKIEAGQFTLAADEYTVADMVATVSAATESLARTKGLDFTTSVAPNLPTGTGDARRLAQVLLNLVGNALKFTDKGGVEIRAQRAGDNFALSVVDSGPGIAEADQQKIFEEFQQVDNSSTRKKGGTGLGLSISRKIVELHGGRITVQSAPGKGSTFTVTVPIKAPSTETTPTKEAAQ
jgi:signal transduction histidine kinase